MIIETMKEYYKIPQDVKCYLKIKNKEYRLYDKNDQRCLFSFNTVDVKKIKETNNKTVVVESFLGKDHILYERIIYNVTDKQWYI